MHAVRRPFGQVHGCRIGIGRHPPCRFYGFADGLFSGQGIESGPMYGARHVDKGLVGQDLFDDRHRFGHDRKEMFTKLAQGKKNGDGAKDDDFLHLSSLLDGKLYVQFAL